MNGTIPMDIKEFQINKKIAELIVKYLETTRNLQDRLELVKRERAEMRHQQKEHQLDKPTSSSSSMPRSPSNEDNNDNTSEAGNSGINCRGTEKRKHDDIGDGDRKETKDISTVNWQRFMDDYSVYHD